jgi:hypothetical protein
MWAQLKQGMGQLGVTFMSNEKPNPESSDRNDWLDALIEIRQRDKAKHEAKAKLSDVDLSILKKQNQEAARLLSLCQAHKLLRHVKNVLLEGKGTIDVFDRTTEYERAIALIWEGPVSQARIPNPQKPETCQCILVGATSRKVYVNRRELEFVTPEALKQALVWAAANPLQWVPESKTDKAKK